MSVLSIDASQPSTLPPTLIRDEISIESHQDIDSPFSSLMRLEMMVGIAEGRILAESGARYNTKERRRMKKAAVDANI